jgi:hypothetical protein
LGAEIDALLEVDHKQRVFLLFPELLEQFERLERFEF